MQSLYSKELCQYEDVGIGIFLLWLYEKLNFCCPVPPPRSYVKVFLLSMVFCSQEDIWGPVLPVHRQKRAKKKTFPYCPRNSYLRPTLLTKTHHLTTRPKGKLILSVWQAGWSADSAALPPWPHSLDFAQDRQLQNRHKSWQIDMFFFFFSPLTQPLGVASLLVFHIPTLKHWVYLAR